MAHSLVGHFPTLKYTKRKVSVKKYWKLEKNRLLMGPTVILRSVKRAEDGDHGDRRKITCELGMRL
jgi:hypothetical protein